MGGGGQLDSTVVSKANTALYTTFAVFGFTAGTFLNYCMPHRISIERNTTVYTDKYTDGLYKSARKSPLPSVALDIVSSSRSVRLQSPMS